MKRICLIDLSGIARQYWHATEHEGASAMVGKTLQAVTGFAAGFDAVGICVDAPPYRRSEMSPEYKAHREKTPAVYFEQLAEVVRQLDRDGYHILSAQGFEADDVIATVCEWAAEKRPGEIQIVIVSADKDLLQLVRVGNVEVISSATGAVYADAEAVVAKLGVKPELVADWLALVGDKSDGIAGIKGVGPKTAAAWLDRYGGVESVLMNADKLEPERFREAVVAGRDVIAKSFQLAQLMYDAPINPEVLLTQKEAKRDEPTPSAEEKQEAPEAEIVEMPQQTAALAKIEQRPMVEGVTWERALEPQHSGQAFALAKYLFQSRMFGDWPNPEAILGVIMTGRSFGIDAVTSLRSFHNIKGKASPTAQLLIGLVKRHPSCEYFRLVETTPNKATWETKRRGEPKATTLSYTIEQAALAGLTNGDSWRKRPETMLRWRGAVELARVVYPDVVSGLYTPDELSEAA